MNGMWRFNAQATVEHTHQAALGHKTRGYRLLWCVLFLVALLLDTGEVALAQTPVEQGDADAAAAFLIDPGTGELIYVVVAFDDTRMSAVDLLRESELPLVTVEFGGLGAGVCSIVETGCDVSACRQRLCQTGDPESPFWQFWRQNDEGEWSLSVLGGSQSQIEDGDIDAWVWTGVEPDLESIGWSEIATRAGAPESIINGERPEGSGVWVSDLSSGSEDEGRSLTGTLISSGIIAALAGVGILLVRKQRNRTVEPS